MTILALLVITMTAAYADIADHPDTISDAVLWEAVDLERPGLEAVRVAVEAEDWPAAAEAWAAYFRTRETPTMHFRRDVWPEWIREHRPQLVEPVIAEADAIGEGDISHGPYVLQVDGREIKWLENPTNDTNYVSAVGSQWFLNCLGRAYLLTGDERYAGSFAWLFDSWYDHQQAIREKQGGLGFDPIYRAYYPGVRARVLADNYYCLARSDALTPTLHVKLMKALLGAAAWLYAQNQPEYQVGNQQVTAVLGCGIVGQVFPEFRDAAKWITLAETRMREHMQQDFFADGGHKEICTQYHKTVLRDVGYVALVAEANGRKGLYQDPVAGPLIERAYDWLAKIVMPTGETPALHSAVFATDYAVHLELGARHFGREDFAWLAERVWERGEAPSQKPPFAFANYMVAAPGDEQQRRGTGPRPTDGCEPTLPDWLSVHLEESGFAIMRTGWEPEDRYLMVQHGWGNTGHAYPGALHFIYEANGELVASAPGSPRSYRHPAYAYCHSTPSHNVVTIDGASYPGRPSPGGHAEVVADLPGAWFFAGYHEGYRKSARATIYRDVLAIKGDDSARGPILFRDRVEGGAERVAQWNFHTPLKMRVSAARTARLTGVQTYTLCAAETEAITRATTEKRWHAVLPRDCQPDDCGAEVNVLRWHQRIGDDGAQFTIALVEGEGSIETVGEQAYRVTAGDRAWLVLFCDRAERAQADGVISTARCACVEFREGEPVRGWVFDGTRLVVNDMVWFSEKRATSRAVHPPRL